MAIKFENTPIILRPQFPTADFTGVLVMANSAQLNDSIDMVEIRQLGREGAIAGRPGSPVEGSLSIDFVYGDLSANVGGEQMSAPLKAWFDNLTGTIEYINGEVGPYKFESGLLTNFSFSSEPNSIVTASASFIFYNSALSKESTSEVSNAQLNGIGNGIYSSGDFGDASIGMNNHPFSFSYECSQDFEPSRYIGEVSTALVQRTAGQLSVEIQGDDLGAALTSSVESLCKDRILDAKFTISGLCQPAFGDEYSIKGYVQNRDIAVQEGDIVRGNISIIDYF